MKTIEYLDALKESEYLDALKESELDSADVIESQMLGYPMLIGVNKEIVKLIREYLDGK